MNSKTIKFDLTLEIMMSVSKADNFVTLVYFSAQGTKRNIHTPEYKMVTIDL